MPTPPGLWAPGWPIFDPATPFGFDAHVDPGMIPDAMPLDENDQALIPELAGREPTHNERFLIEGGVLTAASTNVKEFWWNWQNQNLFVRFLSGDLGYYEGVPLSVAVGFIETMSPGRYVWNVLRNHYNWQRIERGPRGPLVPSPWKAQPMRLIPGVLASSRNKRPPKKSGGGAI